MPDDADDEIQFVPVQAFEGHRAALGGTMVAPIASRALKLAIAGIVTVLAIAATLVLVFHEDIDREFGPGPATRPWSAQELEAWLPPEYEEQARKVAGQRTTVVGVRCESYDSVTSLDLPRDRVFRAIAAVFRGSGSSTLN